MKRPRALHRAYGALRIIQVCHDWPKWAQEYFRGSDDGLEESYRMRCGLKLHTRHNRSDFHMIDEIWAYRKYDYFGYRVNTGDVVVDIGANIGTFSLYAAAECGASRVISFEPHPDNYRLLRKNAEVNHLAKVTCVNEAVAGTRGRRTLMLHSTDSGSHSLLIDTGSNEQSFEVTCCTLDDVFARFALSKIDYLKMDCEGAEYEILENSVERLRQIKRISMETHTTSNRRAEDLEALLRGQGFEVKLFDASRLYASRVAN